MKYIGWLIYLSYVFYLRLKFKNNHVFLRQLTNSEKILLVCELLISCICDIPYFDYHLNGSTPSGTISYELSTILASFSFFKLYHFIRLYSDHSIWLSPRTKKKFNALKIDFSLKFAIKADLKLKPLVVITPLAIYTVLVTGYSIRNMERGYSAPMWDNSFFKYATNGWWNSIITMTTVGYGDIYPKTDSGRFICFCTALIGVILISLYVSALNSAITFNKQEFLSYLEIKSHKHHKDIKNKSSDIIKTALLLKEATNKRNLAKVFIIGMRLKNLISKNVDRYSMKKYISPNEMILEIEKKISFGVMEIKSKIIDVTYVSEKLNNIRAEQKSIESNLDQAINDANLTIELIQDLNLN